MSETRMQASCCPLASPISDRDIREALVKHLRVGDPSAAIFHELSLARGEGRADVVSVNGIMSAYEIKSEQDSLRRLTDQCVRYDRAFDESSVVIANRHLKQVRSHIPERWGIFVVEGGPNDIVLNRIRSPKANRQTDPEVLVRLLWKTECLRLLRRQGIGLPQSTPILNLWERLLKFPTSVLRNEVRGALKSRQAAPRLFQCDD
jgi:hypothetical protein